MVDKTDSKIISNNSKIKVYELAKNLGIKSVFLMDKIRKEWNLPIKSHMEVLSPEMVKKIQDNFLAEAEAKKTPTKKTTKRTTKKTAAKKATTTTAKKTTTKKATTKTTTKKTATKTTTKKITTKKTATKTTAKKTTIKKAAAEVQQAEIPKEVPKSRVIRRRKEQPQSQIKTTVDDLITEEASTNRDQSAAPKSVSKGMRSDLISVKKSDSLKDIFLDEDNNKEQDKKTVKGQDSKAPKKSFTEKEVVSKFNSTDFRKREIIFQPKKKRVIVGNFKKTTITTPKLLKRILKIHGEMNLETLCKKMGIKKIALIKKLKSDGVDTAELKSLDFDTIALIASDFGFEAKNVQRTEESLLEAASETSKEEKQEFSLKPPVVTIMGHVDHGKTTLLDTIRQTKVVDGEAGGITQHIGAYSVKFKKQNISFIDTPGHEAFTAMRARGAQVTDIAIIVVAADDGVMPQTMESINHAKAAKTPIIVAVTKMDSPDANVDKIKQQMSEHEIVSEDWGGETSFIPVAALKGEGIQDLLEQISLLAEVQELRCNEQALAKGVVLEARMEKGRGCVVSLIIQDGTLKVGDMVIAGQATGRVRQMKNDSNQTVKEMKPGFPVEIIGLNFLPEAGDTFNVIKNEKTLKNLKDFRQEQQRLNHKGPALLTVDELLEKTYAVSQIKELNVIVKTDVRGSLEAIKASLEKLKGENAILKVIHSGAGAINESDILLASTASAVVLGFNVRPDNKAATLAKQESIDIHSYSIIYELLDDVKKMMLGLLDPDFVEEALGQAEVRDVFHISKLGTVAGSYVTSGKIKNAAFVRLVRDGQLIYEGKIQSLRRFKDDTKEVTSGFECGISIENFNDIKPKDVLEVYIKKEVAKTEI